MSFANRYAVQNPIFGRQDSAALDDGGVSASGTLNANAQQPSSASAAAVRLEEPGRIAIDEDLYESESSCHIEGARRLPGGVKELTIDDEGKLHARLRTPKRFTAKDESAATAGFPDFSAQNPTFEREEEDGATASVKQNDVTRQLSPSSAAALTPATAQMDITESQYVSVPKPGQIRGGVPGPLKSLTMEQSNGVMKVHAVTRRQDSDLPRESETQPPGASSTPEPPAADTSSVSSAQSSEQGEDFAALEYNVAAASVQQYDVTQPPPPVIKATRLTVSALESSPPPPSAPPPNSPSPPPPPIVYEVQTPPVDDDTMLVVQAQTLEVFTAIPEQEVFQKPLDHSLAVDQPDENQSIEIPDADRPTYQSIVEHLYDKAVDLIDADKATCCDKCCECCCTEICQTVDCGAVFSSARNRTTEGKFKKEVVTAALRKGREVGFRILTDAVFPLFRGIVRDVWIILEWLLVLIGLILSIASFSLGNRAAFNILHLVLAILAFVLASLDAFFSLRDHVSCKAGKLCIATTDTILEGGEVEPTKEQMEGGVPTTEPRKCWSKCKDLSDLSRIIASELLLYPLLVCDLFEFILGKGWEGKSAGDRVNFALFIFGIIGLILYVYLMRLYVLASAIHHLRMIRKPKGIDKDRTDDADEASIGKASLYFQSYFFVHVFLQMLAQICMLIAISIKIQVDNKNVSSDDDPVTVSGALWFMLAAGYVMPIIGILTFFLVTYYWVQFQLPNSIVIDFLKILEMPGADHVIFPKTSMKEVKEKIDKISMCFSKSEILKDLRSISFMTKFSYAFSAPVLVILCLMYTACQLGFAVVTVVFINSSTYTGFYVVAGFFGAVANLYVFAVAALWTVIISGIILAVAIVIALVLLYCILAMCCSSQSNTQRTRTYYN